MQLIQLTQGKISIVDDEDFEWLRNYTWHLSSRGYAATSVIVNEVHRYRLMHRMIMGNPNFDIDHADCNKLNNARSNLRPANKSKNTMNQPVRRDNKCGYKGVVKRGKRFVSVIHLDGKQKSLGTFDTAEQAALIYNEAAKTYFGEYAWLNEVKS